MTPPKKKICFSGIAAVTAVCLLVFCSDAVAAENVEGWRPLYDLVMRWVNFLILAFIIVKFGKAPLMNFLKGQQESHEKDIRLLEKEKDAALEKVRETEKMIADSTQRFEGITARIIDQGEKKKQAIIEGAREESRLMLKGARRKIDSQLAVAHEQLKMELVDAAISIAMGRLAAELTASDNQKIVDGYIHSIKTA